MASPLHKKHRLYIYIFFGTIALLFTVALYNVFKPLPNGVSYAGPERIVNHIRFLKDFTWADKKGRNVSQQEIFDTALAMIRQAKQFILLDMFLFNDFMGNGHAPYRKLSYEITEALIAQKKNTQRYISPLLPTR